MLVPIDIRSFIKVVTATAQPLPSWSTRCESGTLTSSRKTSLNDAPPVIWRSGRAVTPGARMSTMK